LSASSESRLLERHADVATVLLPWQAPPAGADRAVADRGRALVGHATVAEAAAPSQPAVRRGGLGRALGKRDEQVVDLVEDHLVLALPADDPGPVRVHAAEPGVGAERTAVGDVDRTRDLRLGAGEAQSAAARRTAAAGSAWGA
jgi:hypothetical protein